MTRDIVCVICGTPCQPSSILKTDDDENVWMLPLYVCSKPVCLEKLGGEKIGPDS